MTMNFENLADDIKSWGKALGFQEIGITNTELAKYETRFNTWLDKKFHGTMDYMAKHGAKRTQPAALIPETISIISLRMNYLPPDPTIINVLRNKNMGYISRYALGRDYHKILRKRSQQLADKITARIPNHHYRVFCDSAPVLEKAIAEKAGLGFIGKHTNLINTKAGSWFFLSEIYTNIPLPIDKPVLKNHCGSCHACIDVCPTRAIVAPYQLDARRCISYLTIELRDAIPLEFRSLIGNRIYGCDDCQLICPWNKFAKFTDERDFHPRHDLQAPQLLDLFKWDEATFLRKTEGSAIRRIGFSNWQRNIVVALGNAPFDTSIVNALQKHRYSVTPLVRVHLEWALVNQLRFAKQARANVKNVLDNAATRRLNL